MIRSCYSTFHVGPRIFGEKEPFEDRSITDGLCDRCYELEMEQIDDRPPEHRLSVKMGGPMGVKVEMEEEGGNP